jgi:hypothetical protein
MRPPMYLWQPCSRSPPSDREGGPRRTPGSLFSLALLPSTDAPAHETPRLQDSGQPNLLACVEIRSLKASTPVCIDSLQKRE